MSVPEESASYREEWAKARDRLTEAVTRLGFPEELGLAAAKTLGSPKAMHRLTVYLEEVKPDSAELIVDEMLGICSDIETWREKKLSREANSRYNEFRYFGPGWESDEE